MSAKVSPLGPVDPASLPPINDEEEKEAPWIIRKLVGVSGKSIPFVQMGDALGGICTPVREIEILASSTAFPAQIKLCQGSGARFKAAPDYIRRTPCTHVVSFCNDPALTIAAWSPLRSFKKSNRCSSHSGCRH